MRIFILFLFFFTAKSQNIYVYDGDTFKYNDLKIRLYNIDALEKKQPHSEESYYFLKRILKNKALKYIILKYDRYNRAICKVYINGKDLSLLMVETGNAFVYRRYCSSFIFLSAEKEAKKKRLGIWKYNNINPEIFRRT